MRGIVPVALTIVEHSTVADAHPTVVVAELIGMGHDGEGITATTGDVGARLAVIWAVDILRAYYTGVVRYLKAIIGHEEIVVARRRIVDNLGSLSTLPTAVDVTCIDTFHHLVEFRQRGVEWRHLFQRFSRFRI